MSGASAACCTHERGICHPGVDWRAEVCPARRRAGLAGGCGVELAEWNRVAAHPHAPFPKAGCPGSPQTQSKLFLLKSLGQKLFPGPPVPQACRLALGQRRWSQRLSGVPSPARGPAPSAPLQAAPRFPLRCPWCPGSSAAPGATSQDFSCSPRAPRLRSALWAGHSGG